MKQTYLIAGLEPRNSTSIHNSVTMESVVGIVGEKTKLDNEGAHKVALLWRREETTERTEWRPK